MTLSSIRILSLIAALGFASSAAHAEPASQPSRPSGPPVGPEALEARLTLVFEVDEHHLKVQEMWQLTNHGRGPLPASVLDFRFGTNVRRLQLDEDAKGFEADEPGTMVRATQGIPAGGTASFAASYLLNLSGRTALMQRRLPVPVTEGRAIFENISGLTVDGSTALEPRIRDMNGLSFKIFEFAGLPPGHDFQLRVVGLPSRSTLPRDVAMVLAALAFVWMVVELSRRRQTLAPARVLGALSAEARRDRLLAALELLEQDRQAGRIEGKSHAQRRKTLMQELALVLREIDLVASARAEPPSS